MSPIPYTAHLKIQLQTFTELSVNVYAYHTLLKVEYCYDMALNAVMKIHRELASYVGSTTNLILMVVLDWMVEL